MIAVGAFTKYGVEAHSTSGQAPQPLQEQEKHLPWDVSTPTRREQENTYLQQTRVVEGLATVAVLTDNLWQNCPNTQTISIAYPTLHTELL